MGDLRRTVDRLSYENSLAIIESIEEIRETIRLSSVEIRAISERLRELELVMSKDKFFILGIVFCFTTVFGMILTLASQIKGLLQ